MSIYYTYIQIVHIAPILFKYILFLLKSGRKLQYIGDDLIIIETITDNNGDAVDLTGATIVTTVVDRNGTDIAEITTTSHTTPLSGITTIQIPDTTTSSWSMGCYDLQSIVTLAGGRVFTIENSTVNTSFKI